MFGWLRREPAHIMEKRWQVSDALAGYPPYQPPDWDPDTKSMHDANAEYKQFFFDKRHRRSEALQMFLAKFDVAMTLDDPGIMAVSAWCPIYADLLVDGLQTETLWAAYHGFESQWTGPLLGLNPIFDLGVYFGECLLSRNSRFAWQPSRGPEPHCVTHYIFGQRSGRPFDPIDYMYTWCRNIRAAKIPPTFTVGTEFIQPDSLYGSIHGQSL